MANRKPPNLGPRGERLAEAELLANGFEILARNVRLKHVEFDLVARRGDETWFVEVKTRSTIRGGYPYEQVSDEKRVRMESGALEFLEARGEGDSDHRLMAASIMIRSDDGPAVLEWMPLE